VVLPITAIYLLEIPNNFSKLFQDLKHFFLTLSLKGKTGDATIDKVIKAAGYSYDQTQDIFYTNKNAWQRNNGYCRLYDEATVPLGIAIHCEPIYFEYYGRRWLIEFWKGQYGLATGCEIGVYSTERADVSIPGVFVGPFYYPVKNTDTLLLSFSLSKNGNPLFTREARQWWLTGFKLGEFSEPEELTMTITITFEDIIMLNAFTQGLKDAGYKDSEICIKKNTINLKFNKPNTPQPIAENITANYTLQKNNKLLCEKYINLAGVYTCFPDRANNIKRNAPELYNEIFNIGKPKEIFDIYEKIRFYLY